MTYFFFRIPTFLLRKIIREGKCVPTYWLAFGFIQKSIKAVSKQKVPEKFPGAPFLVSFSEMPVVQKDTKNGAPGYFFGPSYFVTALVLITKTCFIRHMLQL